MKIKAEELRELIGITGEKTMTVHEKVKKIRRLLDISEIEHEAQEDEEQDKVWAGDLFGVTRQAVEGEDDTFLVEVPGVDYSEVIADVRIWRDDVLSDPPENSEEVFAAEQLAERLSDEYERARETVQRLAGGVKRADDRVIALKAASVEADWIAPVRAILKPHEEELNKAVNLLYSEVTEVGLNCDGRVTQTSAPRDGVEDEGGKETDD